VTVKTFMLQKMYQCISTKILSTTIDNHCDHW